MEEKIGYLDLLNVSKEVGLPVKKITDMFAILLASESADNTELLRMLGVSRNVLNQVKEKLSKYFTPASTTTSLSDLGKKAAQEMELDNSMEENLIKFDSEESARIEKVLKKHKSSQPDPVRKYDQFIATIQTVAKRAVLMKFLGDVRAKRILFLGDDDFTSVAISELRSAAKVQVVDIDCRILNGIKDVSKDEGYNIETGIADFRKEISVDYKGKFDVVFTDPPYTTEGITLFLSRAVEALDLKNQAARIYFCYGNSDRAKEKFLPVYEVIYKSGLMLRFVFDKFNRYTGAESIGSSSTLFVCEVTPKTKILVKENSNAEIYTNN